MAGRGRNFSAVQCLPRPRTFFAISAAFGLLLLVSDFHSNAWLQAQRSVANHVQIALLPREAWHDEIGPPTLFSQPPPPRQLHSLRPRRRRPACSGVPTNPTNCSVTSVLRRWHVTTQELLIQHLRAVWPQNQSRVMVDLGSHAGHGVGRNISDALLWLDHFHDPGSLAMGVDAFEDYSLDMQHRFDDVEPYRSMDGVRKISLHAALAAESERSKAFHLPCGPSRCSCTGVANGVTGLCMDLGVMAAYTHLMCTRSDWFDDLCVDRNLTRTTPEARPCRIRHAHSSLTRENASRSPVILAAQEWIDTPMPPTTCAALRASESICRHRLSHCLQAPTLIRSLRLSKRGGHGVHIGFLLLGSMHSLPRTELEHNPCVESTF